MVTTLKEHSAGEHRVYIVVESKVVNTGGRRTTAQKGQYVYEEFKTTSQRKESPPPPPQLLSVSHSDAPPLRRRVTA